MYYEKLKNLRKQKKLNQIDVAKFLNVEQVTISRYESGQSEPDIETLIKLANLYETTLDDLLDRELPKELVSVVIDKMEFNQMKKTMNKIENQINGNNVNITIGNNNKVGNINLGIMKDKSNK